MTKRSGSSKMQRFTLSAKKLMLTLTLLALAGFAAVLWLYDRSFFLGVRLLDGPRAEALWQQPGQTACLLILEDEALPRDSASGTTYLPQSLSTNRWQGAIGSAVPGTRLYLIRDEWMEDKAGAIAAGHAFRYLVLDGQGALVDKGWLMPTGLPMVVWSLDWPQDWDRIDGSVLEGEYTGRAVVFDPGASGRYTVTASRMVASIRGNSSRYADKKSFKMELVDGEGLPQNQTLCGLRRDDDWFLNGLSADGSLVREMSGYQLWAQLAADNPNDPSSSRMTYVELVADERYLGIYALQEPLDRKQMQAGDGDYLYQSGGHRWPTVEELDYITGQSWRADDWAETADGLHTWQQAGTTYYWGPDRMRIENHDVRIEAEVTPEGISYPWTPLRQFLQTMQDPSSTLDAVDALCERSNLTDMELFRQAVFGWDNLTNNTYYLARQTDQGHRFFYLPWDMDHTFGGGWEACVNDGTMNSTAYTVLGRDKACDDGYGIDTQLPRTAALAAEDTRSARWAELRQDSFSTENIVGLLEHNHARLAESGALARDRDRWTRRDGDESIVQLTEYMTLRLAALDEYYGS